MPSIFELEDALVEFIAANTSDFRLKSNEQTDELVEPRVYSGYVPRDEVGAILPGDITVYPAIIVSAQSGAGDHTSDVVSVLVVVGVFDNERDQQGYRDCVNVTQRIRDRIREVSIIRARYAWQPPLNWRAVRRGGGDFPYFFAEIDVNFGMEIQMTSQYDVTIGDGDKTPGRYNATPIPTPEPNEHWKHPTPPPVKFVDHYVDWLPSKHGTANSRLPRDTMKTKQGNFIYIGPSIPQVGLKENTLYRDVMPPESLMRFAREKPVLRALYISTKDLARTKQAMGRKGTVEHTASELLRTLAKSAPR